MLRAGLVINKMAILFFQGNMEVNITEQCHGSLTALAKVSLK